MQSKTLIFGHRGYPKQFPENSLAGFRYALAHGIEGLEFDVHLTRDQVPMIMHDEKINRTTDDKGFIQDYSLSELRQVHLKNGESIPTLDELLTLVGNSPVQLNLEFKTDKIQYPEIERIVFAMLEETTLNKSVIFSSFHLPTLERCQQLAPNEIYCWLTKTNVPNPNQFLIDHHLAGLHLKHYQSDMTGTQRIWTVNRRGPAIKLFKQQVAGIFTDDFVQMMQIRDQTM